MESDILDNYLLDILTSQHMSCIDRDACMEELGCHVAHKYKLRTPIHYLRHRQS